MVLRSASSFMCAIISSSPDLTSVTTAVMSPSASNLGLNARPSSMSCVDAAKDGSCVPPSATRASGRREDFSKRDCELPLRAAQHGHETYLLAGVVSECAGKMRGHCQRAGLFNPSQGHAHVLGFDHHCDATRLQNFIDCRRDLRRQVLLRLQATGIDVDQARKL